MAVTIKNVNERIADKGIELVKGNGYFYFVVLDGFPDNTFVPDSVMVNSVRQLSLAAWMEAVDAGREAAAGSNENTPYYVSEEKEFEIENKGFTACLNEPNKNQEQPQTAEETKAMEANVQENTVDVNEKIAQLEETLEQAKAASEQLKADVKEATKNHKAAVSYAKSVGEDDETAAASVAGWAEALETRTAAEVANRDAVKEIRAALAAAKKEANSGVKKEAAERVEQNGQVQPRPASKSGQLWAIFDEATEARGSTCAIADVIERCLETTGMTEGSIRSAYSHWRKFHGVEKGRIQSANASASMSEEKRVDLVSKLTEQLTKAEARAAGIRDKLAALQPTEAV